MQMKDSLKMYNNLVAECFRDCVNSFRAKSLDAKEEACVTKCAEKYIKLTQVREAHPGDRDSVRESSSDPSVARRLPIRRVPGQPGHFEPAEALRSSVARQAAAAAIIFSDPSSDKGVCV